MIPFEIPLPRSLLFTGLFLSALALSGCGVQFFYNNLDGLAKYELGRYVDMTPSQQAAFDAQFQSLWLWHRSEELPKYASEIERFAGAVDDGVTDTLLERAYTTMQGWFQRVSTKGAPAARDFLKSLGDAQVGEVAQAFEKENEKWARRDADDSLEDRQKKWRRNVERLLKRFLGALDAEQRQRLVDASADYQPARELWGEYRLRWQGEFLRLLEIRGSNEAFDVQYARVFGAQEPLYGERLIRIEQHNRTLTMALLLAVLESMDDKQTARLKERLGGWAEDFRELSGQVN